MTLVLDLQKRFVGVVFGWFIPWFCLGFDCCYGIFLGFFGSLSFQSIITIHSCHWWNRKKAHSGVWPAVSLLGNEFIIYDHPSSLLAPSSPLACSHSKLQEQPVTFITMYFSIPSVLWCLATACIQNNEHEPLTFFSILIMGKAGKCSNCLEGKKI